MQVQKKERERCTDGTTQFANYVRGQKKIPKKRIAEAFPQLIEGGADPLALDLVEKLLQYDPDKRLTGTHPLVLHASIYPFLSLGLSIPVPV